MSTDEKLDRLLKLLEPQKKKAEKSDQEIMEEFSRQTKLKYLRKQIK